ncbi:MAG: hypothetical protein M3295_07285 [Chloroflexota bacterium]|nr:hypothetical protein [Chloroflexota bacterium]
MAFVRFAGAAAILAGLAGFAYSVSFVVLARADARLGGLLAELFLLTGAILSSAVYVGLYRSLRKVEPGFAGWAAVLGVGGSFGAALHGAYNLAVALNPSGDRGAAASLPSAADPRGFMTFAVTGVAVLVVSGLIARADGWPSTLAWLGYVAGALLVVVYLGRLIVLDPASALILLPAAVAGFLVNPAWLIWVGLTLRGTAAGTTPAPG